MMGLNGRGIMKFNPSLPSFKEIRFSLAVVFAAYGGTLWFIGHDQHNGLWALAVSFALVLGLLPPWLTDHPYPAMKDAAKPEKYRLLPQ